MEESQSVKPRLGFKRVLLRILCVLLVTVLLLCAFLYGVIFMVCRGPSETARNQFVLSVRETSAIGFLANLVLSSEEIAAIEARPVEVVVETDTSLVEINAAAGEQGPVADGWGYVDEDGDGLILVPVAGESYTGYMLIVLDPTRVVLGFSPDDLGIRGYTVAEFAEKFGAVAAVNGGGFYDPSGMGNGSIPEHLVVKDGVIYCGDRGIGSGFVGLDDKGGPRQEHPTRLRLRSDPRCQRGADGRGFAEQRSQSAHRDRPALRRRDFTVGDRRPPRYKSRRVL